MTYCSIGLVAHFMFTFLASCLKAQLTKIAANYQFHTEAHICLQLFSLASIAVNCELLPA